MHWIQSSDDVHRLLRLLTFVDEHGEVGKGEVVGIAQEPDRLLSTGLLAGALLQDPDGRVRITCAGRVLVALLAKGEEERATALLVMQLPFYRQHFLLRAAGVSQSSAEALGWVQAWLTNTGLDRRSAQQQVLQMIGRRFLRGVPQPSTWRWLQALDGAVNPERRRLQCLAYLSQNPAPVDLYAVVPRLAEPGYSRFGFLDTLECMRLYVLLVHVIADQFNSVVHIGRLLGELSMLRKADLDVEPGWHDLADYVSFFGALGVYLLVLPGTARSSLLNPVEVTMVPATNQARLWRWLGVSPTAPDLQAIVDHLEQRGLLIRDQAAAGTNRSLLILPGTGPRTAQAAPFADWVADGTPADRCLPVAFWHEMSEARLPAIAGRDSMAEVIPKLASREGFWGGLPAGNLDEIRALAQHDEAQACQGLIDLCYRHVPHIFALISLLLLQRQHPTSLTLWLKRGGRCWVVSETGQQRALLETLDMALRDLGCDLLDEWRSDGRKAMALEHALVEWAVMHGVAVDEGGVLRIALPYYESFTGGHRLAWWHAHNAARERFWKMLHS